VKTLILISLMLTALAVPARAETCTGRVKVDAFVNELAGGRIAYVGECMFLPPLPKRILRSCPKGSYCRVEGVTYSEGEVGPEIDTFTSITRESEPKCAPVPMDGKRWIGVGGWKYASKSCTMGPRTRPKDRLTLASPAYAAPKGEWFLILDTWYCSSKSCAVAGEPEDWVLSETYPSKKQCLIAGRYITDGHTEGHVPEGFYVMTRAKVSPRCVYHRG